MLQLIEGSFISTLSVHDQVRRFSTSLRFHIISLPPIGSSTKEGASWARLCVIIHGHITQITDGIEKPLKVLLWVSRKPEKSRYQSPEE